MKRRLLIAEDELINREILKELLEKDYELIFACDGAETLDIMREKKDALSLVLLDIMMPIMTGTEVLKVVKEDPELSRIPVIVATSEKETEVESLRLGAADFIPKPYPAVDVINARILRTIELSEDRAIIQSTERDSLTGLYTKEYFFRYAGQFDYYNKETDTDAAIVDINHFRMLNERYGKSYGDKVLQNIAQKLSDLFSDGGGLVCRQEADTFLIYSPHRNDYEDMLEDISSCITADDTPDKRVRLRMGIYYNTDKSIDIDRRFDRAKMAADTVRGTFNKTVGIYDADMHKNQLYAEQLVEDFQAAIRENQFVVYYQPKFDIRPDTPVLASAEALVRWNHPELGMISPGLFIPLFEENGLIQQLDEYVWKETARQIRKWKDELNCSIPVSVNVSRIDLYDPDITKKLSSITEELGLNGKDLFLEVTESAYTRDSDQMIDAVEKLRSLGFRIEMDDFGTGYSSLNMISSLPIDALKLDMQFVRNAFSEGGDSHMVEVIIGISDFLSVPVIAEGVETEGQLRALKNLGCDMVQGYFFSRPVPASEFEAFILQKKEADRASEEKARRSETISKGSMKKVRDDKLDVIYSADAESDNEESEPPSSAAEETRRGIHLRSASILMAIIAVIFAAAIIMEDMYVARGYERMAAASERYVEAQEAAADMESGSDYLTDKVRSFVVTGDITYLNEFIEEIEVTKRRDNAVKDLEELLKDSDSNATESLKTALKLSNELVNYENKAMRLILETGSYDMSEIPESITGIELTPEERSLSSEELRKEAQNLVYDNNYMLYKTRIRDYVSMCTETIVGSSSKEFDQASARLSLLVRIQTFMTVLFMLMVLGTIAMISIMVRRPLSNMVKLMEREEEIPPTGVEELRFVTRTYNQILKENKEARKRLSHEASHDALTGLLNRGAYDLLMEDARKDHIALILVDVDYFKTVNDTYGHDTGDRILKQVATILKASFRSVDIICRFGGDEFTVVMTRVTREMSQLVLNKMSRVNDILQHPKDDLPPVSASIGIAFSDPDDPDRDLFKDADRALYRVKKAGRNGCAIFDAELDEYTIEAHGDIIDEI